MIEVTHEEELADLKEQQERLRVIRKREEEAIKRLEEENKKRSEEAARRLGSFKPTAAQLLQDHIADLLPAVLEELEPLKDVDNREELEEQLKPWLAQEVAEEIGQMIDSRDLLEGKHTLFLVAILFYCLCLFQKLLSKFYGTELSSTPTSATQRMHQLKLILVLTPKFTLFNTFFHV